MISRYCDPYMEQLWSEANKWQTYFRVELAVVEAHEKFQNIPAGTSSELKKKLGFVDWKRFASEVDRHEEVTRHDLIAFLMAVEEHFGEPARFVHLGLTSSDVADTAFALLLAMAGEQLCHRLRGVSEILKSKALLYEDVPCLGRTHGQAAEVTTFGMKLLSFYSESERMLGRLRRATDGISFGKLSGAIGTFSNIEPEIETAALASLGLQAEPIATQVVPRDRHADFFSTLALLGGFIERVGVEIRHLMRSEVAEVSEPFGQGQRGSSAMPHKKNPILTENLTGLARLLRSHAQAAFENQALWHERDISHSSVERVIGPDATSLADFSLKRLAVVLEGLEVFPDQMRKNLEAAGDLIYSQAILTELVKKGVPRQEAYGWVQAAALRARAGTGTFIENLASCLSIKSYLGIDRIQTLCSAAHFLRHKDILYQRVLL